MDTCKYSSRCAYYTGRLHAPGYSMDLLKEIFCHHKPDSCARYKRARFVGAENASNPIDPLGFHYMHPSYLYEKPVDRGM